MAKSLMIQGTSSGVGKSILTTGICRILKEDGFSVAPFKSQNMSNNSYILENGLKIATSQAIQAFACGIEPNTDMNPVLLKPNNGAMEVIIHGKSDKHMDSIEYKSLKKDILSLILKSYERLSDKYDIVIIEGAGSPVEINLKTDDIVNMGIAKKVNSPVILVADIDRGGVFASVYGTLALFDESERSLVKGIIINKCIGKPEFFVDVKNAMERITNLPVIGMIPYTKIEIEDEDGLIDPKTGPKTSKSSSKEFMDKQFDELAKTLRSHLDMETLKKIILEKI